MGHAQLIAGKNSKKTDAQGPSPQMTVPLEGGEFSSQGVQAGLPPTQAPKGEAPRKSPQRAAHHLHSGQSRS